MRERGEKERRQGTYKEDGVERNKRKNTIRIEKREN